MRQLNFMTGRGEPQMDTDEASAFGVATKGFGVRGLVRAFRRRLVAVECKRRVQASATGRWTRPCLVDKSTKR